MIVEDPATIAVDRCVFELRQGRPVIVTDAAASWLVAPLAPPAEAVRHRLEALAPGGVSLLLNPYRAGWLGLGRRAVALPVSDAGLGTQALERIGYGQPSVDERVMLGAARSVDDDAVMAAFELARLAETVPALLAVVSGPTTAAAFAALRDRGMVLAAPAAVVGALRNEAAVVRRLAHAPVPMPTHDGVRFVAYRTRYALADHVAVVIGQPERQTAPLVRLHSACLTGDIFRSLRCDCGEQLDTAVARMSSAGHGVICYLAQEGRGIGIANKLRAYDLQNAGLDTLEANEALGFAVDERDFSIAANMLRDLGITRIRLMTNNPDKLERFSNEGIDVEERVGLRATLNPHNERYIHARVAKSGYMHAVNG